jgi:hypothetical protein
MQYKFNVTGLTFRTAETPELLEAKPAGEVTFELDPTNQFAKNPRGALKVIWGDYCIGFVPDAERALQDKIISAMDTGANINAAILEYSYAWEDENEKKHFNDDHVGVLCHIVIGVDVDVPVTKPVGERKLLSSWNEEGVLIEYFPETHQYWYDGILLRGVTSLVKEMYPPFDREMIAEKLSFNWMMDKQDILDMWSNNGNAASMFGTAIHTLLENYERFGERGLPKMPMLREIVESFPWPKGVQTHTEVLLTSVSRGICGQCDRLIVNGSRHTVCDIKVNIDATKKESRLKNKLYPDMPNNKLTKYNAQMSIYAEMLEESEYEVNDKVVPHVFDGAWENYTLDRIKGILDKVSTGAGSGMA